MARSSSRGSRRSSTWAVEQKPRTMPRVVRLGRAANDNTRQRILAARLLVVVLSTALTMLAVYFWRMA